MRTILIDDDVYRFLQGKAIPFEETTPNETLRRLFGLAPGQGSQPSNQTRLPRPELECSASNKLQNQSSSPKIKIALPRRTGEMRRMKASLRLLVEAGLLTEGQTLYMHDYDNSRIPGADFEATVEDNHLIWKQDGQAYSMSALAILLLRKRGHRGDSVRGPARWFTADETSVQTLWDRFLKDYKR